MQTTLNSSQLFLVPHHTPTQHFTRSHLQVSYNTLYRRQNVTEIKQLWLYLQLIRSFAIHKHLQILSHYRKDGESCVVVRCTSKHDNTGGNVFDGRKCRDEIKGCIKNKTVKPHSAPDAMRRRNFINHTGKNEQYDWTIIQTCVVVLKPCSWVTGKNHIPSDPIVQSRLA